MNSRVSLVKCKSYERALVQEAIRKAIDLIGGIAGFIKPQSRVLVKPNLLLAKEPEFGITTHPEVVRTVIKILKEINCKIFVGDSSDVWGNQIEDADEVYLRSGIKKISEEEGVELVKFDKRSWHRKIPLTTWLDECDYLVNLPKFKTHNYTILTGAIKNLFGLVPGTYKTELHRNYFEVNAFSKMLVDIYEIARPALTIIDGIVAMEGDGPGTSGKLRQMNLLLAGVDGVALDSLLAFIMGLQPLEIPTTKEAAKRDLGLAQINSISVLGEKKELFVGRPFLLPASHALIKDIPKPVIKLGKVLLKTRPYVERHLCIRCAACVKACPTGCISISDKKVIFNYSKCIACFCCQEICPSAAIRVKKNPLIKLIRLCLRIFNRVC